MSDLSTFLEMGGYARYVWTSYGLTLLVLAANLILPLQRERVVRRRLARRHGAGRS